MSYAENDGQCTMKDEFNDKLVASIKEVNQDLAAAIDKRTGLGLEYLNLRVTYQEDRKITEAKVKEATAEIEALRKQRRQLLAAAKALGIDVSAIGTETGEHGGPEGGEQADAEAEG
jgi:hypothetical protein